MVLPTNFDTGLLRSFVTGIELGSFAKAAEQLHRSQSAISLQLKKLEEQAGETLLRKEGRGLALTPAGEIMLSYAKRLLELNDEALAAVRGVAVKGSVRFGFVQDFAESPLPKLLGRFAKAHPGVRVEARVGVGLALAEAVNRGEIDLALVWGDLPGAHRIHLGNMPIQWIGSQDYCASGEPIALAAFESPCAFRQAGVEALDEAGIPWRISFVSPSLAGLWAAVEGGLGITPRTAHGLPREFKILDGSHGLPNFKTEAKLVLHRTNGQGSPAVQRLQNALVETLQKALNVRPMAAVSC